MYSNKYTTARDLALVFHTFKKDLYGGTTFPKFYARKTHQTCFKKLQDQFYSWKQQEQIMVNVPVYMQAHLALFKKETYAAHLLSFYSYQIYQNYLREKISLVPPTISEHYKQELRQLFSPLLAISELAFCHQHPHLQLNKD